MTSLSAEPTARGLVQLEGRLSTAEASQALRQALDDAALSVPVDLSHSDAAAAAQLTLPPSRLLVFGNPRLGTPFMQEAPLAALDLPLKMLVFETAQGETRVAYDTPAYLRSRHRLTTVDEGLNMAGRALANFAGVATGTSVLTDSGVASDVSEGEGLVTVMSERSGPDTLASLKAAIEQNPQLGIVQEIDHQAAARDAELELGFSTLIVFGSAQVGTPLMQDAPTVGLDLPLKILVAELGNDVVLAYNAPEFVASRHAGLGEQPQLQMMAGALSALTSAAAAE